MKIIERKPIPIYETICEECKSRFQYKKIELHWAHVTCPVCGVSNWASTTPVAYECEEENDEKRYLRNLESRSSISLAVMLLIHMRNARSM